MRILCVCTANICRSVTLEALLNDARAEHPELAEAVTVRSAGTAAFVGAPSCRIAPALRDRDEEHLSIPLSAEAVGWAGFILTADRGHRSAVAALDPRARSRTFTVRQAGRLAEWAIQLDLVGVAEERSRWEADERGSAGAHVPGATPLTRTALVPRASHGPGAAGPKTSSSAAGAASPGPPWTSRFEPGDPRGEVDPLPSELARRWSWLVAQLDAARGVVGGVRQPDPAAGRIRRRRGSVEFVDPDDVPDPHVLGSSLHSLVDEQLRAAVGALTELMVAVARVPAES